MTDDRPCGTILVVDDNAEISRLSRKFLEAAGYTVISAADGEQGILLYERHRSAIVLVITDLVMPKMDGFELADRVLAMDSKLPVLLMSGDAGCDYRELECIVKPFRPAELIEAVNRVLSGAKSRQAAASSVF